MDLFEREHGLIRRMVRGKNYLLTHHAFAEMIADAGYRNHHHQGITRREIDQQTQEPKYVIFGPTSQGLDANVVVKIKGSLVIMTVYLL